MFNRFKLSLKVFLSFIYRIYLLCIEQTVWDLLTVGKRWNSLPKYSEFMFPDYKSTAYSLIILESLFFIIIASLSIPKIRKLILPVNSWCETRLLHWNWLYKMSNNASNLLDENLLKQLNWRYGNRALWV